MARRRLVVVAGATLLLVASSVAVRAATTPPPRTSDVPALESFDPERVGTVEQQAWAAYYYREWARLLQLMLAMIQGQFGLSPAQSLEAAYFATQAQVVWADRGAAGGEAEDLMRQFYTLVREPAGGDYDVDRAAALEVNWWAVHRNRDQYPDSSALARALADLYAEVYRLPVEAALPAGEHRARAMDLSDQWIREGKVRDSPLLAAVRAELIASYQVLHDALAARRTAAPQ
ncbi:MAG TPA: hypothetical protein VFE37_07230 [Chloroflexota bacterium]|nr:hypothetical protein [Chloroflexota bacterium]